MSDFKYILPPNETKIIKNLGDVKIVPTITENISKSLRFNSADSAYLNRTLTQGGSTTTATLSMWFKRSTISGTNYGDMLFHTYNTGVGPAPGNYHLVFLTGSSSTTTDYLAFNFRNTGTYYSQGFYRDPSAWYHLVLNYDTTNSIQSERFRFYINGVRGNWLTGYVPALALNYEFESTLGNTGSVHNLGWYWYGADYYLNGYMADVHFIDGQALLPTNFATTDNRTNSWVAKKYRGSYGNNGYNLKFEDNSGVTAATLGKDSSGNGNNWTPNNFSVTAGVGNDSLVDSPTNYGTDTGVGGEVRGNYATLNPLFGNTGGTITDGNLKLTHTGGANGKNALGVSSVAVSSGKWYGEVTSITANQASRFGIFSTANTTLLTSANPYLGTAVDGYSAFAGGGTFKENNNITTAVTNYGASAPAAGDVYMVALDMDNNKVWFGRNGSWANNGNPNTGLGETFSILSGRSYYFACNNYTDQQVANFGQRPFAYTAPSGFKCLCTTNLPIPRIKKPSLYFDALTYTGTGATQSITSLAFSPDLLWTKGRSLAQSHNFFDTLRSSKRLRSDTTGAEALTTVMLDSNGFTLGAETESNNSGSTFVAWAWEKSPIAGMDIVSYSGTGAARTVPHNLGVAPKMIISKNRGATSNWAVYHASLPSAFNVAGTQVLYLNLTNANTQDFNAWESNNPTSSVFYVGASTMTNNSGSSYIAYCFAEVEGFSKIGSYTGNGVVDGPFIYCGFRPRFIMVKRTDGDVWIIKDTARSIYNGYDVEIYPNASTAEGGPYSPPIMDYLSNGFKLRNNTSASNASGYAYIFAAFAETPFRYANAR